MPIQVSYMGTKQKIAPRVASIIADGPPGPLLDVFSGICAIGSAVADQRQVWCNDVQHFAATVAKAFFQSPDIPINFDLAADIAFSFYNGNRHRLERRFVDLLAFERGALKSGDYRSVKLADDKISAFILSESARHERKRIALNPDRAPYRLFSISYAGGYFGLAQAIQIDSIRYAIDKLREHKQLNQHQIRWLNLALCQAASKVATTTGHFAQHMTVKEETTRRFIAQRVRSVWSEWLRAIFEFNPLRTSGWRARNRVFRKDAVSLLKQLSREKRKPAVIYADPPYTDDQYSRYYHVYETLLLYDYPEIAGIGRYRPDRFTSKFSTKTQVESEIDKLVEACCRIRARLVLSYPSEGLFPDAEKQLRRIIRSHYGESPSVTRIKHAHSTMGASKGAQKNTVDELVFATR